MGRELEDRAREVDQLTTLSLRGDATVQEYMARLRVGQGMPLHQARIMSLLFQSWAWFSGVAAKTKFCRFCDRIGS